MNGHQLYISFGGDDFYWNDIESPGDSGTAVVLGGYLGASTLQLARRGYAVTVFEPVPKFAANLRKNTTKYHSAIEVLEFAASVSEDDVTLQLNGDSTSQTKTEETESTLICKALNFSEWVLEQGDLLDYLEINIEGAEYPLLELMIQEGSISSVKTLTVQFHNFWLNAVEDRERIRQGLSKTHIQVWSFDWVWEKWVLRSKATNLRWPSIVLP